MIKIKVTISSFAFRDIGSFNRTSICLIFSLIHVTKFVPPTVHDLND